MTILEALDQNEVLVTLTYLLKLLLKFTNTFVKLDRMINTFNYTMSIKILTTILEALEQDEASIKL